MSENNIELKSINDLLGMNFFIPSYQRGYRWKAQQVTDLLEDIKDFIKNKKSEGFYCIQPLVVKENIINKDEYLLKLKELSTNNPELLETRNLINKYTRWEVIDGQQRLTTIYILLACLGVDEKNRYSIEYETRNDSTNFLQKIDEREKNANIDYYHMFQAKCTIEEWFKNEESLKDIFKEKLLNKVQFIWYKSVGEDPIKVFTRLNIGKISLTNAELIKALFLNSSIFSENDYQKIRLKQQEIASVWDNIEYTLQNEEFWLFIHDTGYTNPTRIDFIFDLVCEHDKLKLFRNDQNEIKKDDQNKIIGTDKHRTFRYFYEYFKLLAKEKNENTNPITEEKSIEKCWHEVKTIFQTFEEWYNDLELYHYVGYLVDQGTKIDNLLESWNDSGNKSDFISNKLIKEIKEKINNCNNLDAQYEIEKPDKGNYPAKTICKPLLLLHNIQTIINQNKNYKGKDSYQLGVFYKFPFHLYKIENWDVEHIDSNTENDMTDIESQNEYLLNIYNAVSSESQKTIEEFINNKDASNFEELEKLVPNSTENQLSDEDKNKIWNFTLLDSNTNRSYGNSIFSAKRRIIIGKDKGKLISIPKIGKKDGAPILLMDKEKDAQSSFIPPVTKHIFLKYYSSASSSPNIWDKADAEAYKQSILETLKEFGVKNKGDK